MKKYSLLFSAFAGIALIFSACNKELKPCNTYSELSNTGHLVDVSVLRADAPALLDSLAKYPQLQAYKAEVRDGYLRVDCYVYHNNLRMFSQSYGLMKRVGNPEVFKVGDNQTVFTPSVSLTPTTTHNQAIETARTALDFGSSCLTYTLGIIDMAKISDQPGTDEILVWMITDEGRSGRYVAVDAQTNTVVSSDNGLLE